MEENGNSPENGLGTTLVPFFPELHTKEPSSVRCFHRFCNCNRCAFSGSGKNTQGAPDVLHSLGMPDNPMPDVATEPITKPHPLSLVES